MTGKVRMFVIHDRRLYAIDDIIESTSNCPETLVIFK